MSAHSKTPLQEPTHKRFRRDDVITFSESNVVFDIMPYLDILVVEMVLGNKEVRRVYMNNGAAVRIIYKGYFEKLVMDMTPERMKSLPPPWRSTQNRDYYG